MSTSATPRHRPGRPARRAGGGYRTARGGAATILAVGVTLLSGVTVPVAASITGYGPVGPDPASRLGMSVPVLAAQVGGVEGLVVTADVGGVQITLTQPAGYASSPQVVSITDLSGDGVAEALVPSELRAGKDVVLAVGIGVRGVETVDAAPGPVQVPGVQGRARPRVVDPAPVLASGRTDALQLVVGTDWTEATTFVVTDGQDVQVVPGLPGDEVVLELDGPSAVFALRSPSGGRDATDPSSSAAADGTGGGQADGAGAAPVGAAPGAAAPSGLAQILLPAAGLLTVLALVVLGGFWLARGGLAVSSRHLPSMTDVLQRAAPTVVAPSETFGQEIGPDRSRSVATTSWLPPAVGADLLERVGWTVAGIAVLASTVRLYPIGSSSGVAPAVLAPASLLVFVVLVLLWRGGERARRACSWVLLALGATTTSVWSVGTWLAAPAYGTDAVAFNEYSADLLLAGQNPYGVDLSPAFDAYGVPATLSTLTLDGGQVTQLSYPAGAFLPVAAAKLLGLGAQAANVVDLASWLAALVLLFVLLPRPVRWVAVVLLADNLVGGFVTGGVTDPLYLVPLMLALWRWDRFGTGAGLSSWLGPVALGLACSVKQLPWFFAPFLLLVVSLEAHRRGERWWPVAARYAGAAAGVFLLVNGPFMVWDPVAWAGGAFLPLVQPLVPDGQGLVALIVQLGIGGGSLVAVSVAGYAGYAALLLMVAGDYDRWRRGWPLLVVAAFLLPSRSLSSYLLMALPAVMVALTECSAGGGGAGGR